MKQLSAEIGAMMDKHCKPIPLKKLYPEMFGDGAGVPGNDVAVWEQFLKGGAKK